MPCLPNDIIPLYGEIHDATEREAIVPSELRDTMKRYKLKPYTFKPANASLDAGAQALAAYAMVCTVVQHAAEAQTSDGHETTWNHLVHTPLLRSIFASASLGMNGVTEAYQPPPLRKGISVRFVIAMSAQIEPHSLPTVRGSNTDIGPLDSASVSDCQSQITTSTRVSNRGDSKKVDYVLVMDMPKTAQLQEELSRVADDFDCCGVPHINHTAYRPLEKSLIAVSVETKTALPQQDPLLQLGLWTAAWHDRMGSIRASLFPDAPSPRLPTLPLIQVGHLWQVYFACDMRISIDLYGPVTIGSTETVISTYVLIRSLEAIRKWVENTFQDSMRDWFLIGKPPAASSF